MVEEVVKQEEKVIIQKIKGKEEHFLMDKWDYL
jgi:hypothetical protein